MNMGKKPIFLVAGARPNFMKLSPLLKILTQSSENIDVIHTGQHYDFQLSQVFFDDLSLPKPDYFLGVGSGTHAKQTAEIMVSFEEICLSANPRLVVVFGDVNSTLACSLVARKLSIPVAHVESGLRSGNMEMPEEINRILTDHLSSLLFVTSEEARQNLHHEGIETGVHFVGNIMIDNLIQQIHLSDNSTIIDELGLEKGNYELVTLHRPSNVDEHNVLRKLIRFISHNSSSDRIVFPVHPRTNQSIIKNELEAEFSKSWMKISPMGHHDFTKLLKNCKRVWTDSGGIQEESTFLKVNCITLREETERPETVTMGTNTLIKPSSITHKSILEPPKRKPKTPELWDGRSAGRIAKIILEYLEKV